MNFVLLVPNYLHFSAGSRALYLLGEYLTDLGHNVWAVNYQTPPTKPPSWCRMAFSGELPADTIPIVPESIHFNTEYPLVMRWVLNIPGKLGGPQKYTEKERIFYFGDEFTESAFAAAHDGVAHELTIGTIEELPKDEGQVRDLELWYEGKCVGDNSHPRAALRLMRQWPPTRPELFDLLKRTKTLWGYDDLSATYFEAHTMGVDVKLRQNGMWVDYVPPNNGERYFINRERDIENVRRMVDLLKTPK